MIKQAKCRTSFNPSQIVLSLGTLSNVSAATWVDNSFLFNINCCVKEGGGGGGGGGGREGGGTKI